MSGKPSIPASETASIIARYKAGESTEKIGATYGKHRDTIRHVLMRNGVKCTQTGGTAPTPSETVEAIVRRYKAGEGGSALAKEFGLDKRTVYNLLVRAGIGTRPRSNRKGTEYRLPPAAARDAKRARLPKSRHMQKPFNEHAFDAITEESAYWIGFLMADGCISAPVERGSRRLFINLAVKDREHLERFHRFLGASNVIREWSHLDPAGNEKLACGFAVTSNHLTEKLISYGVTPRKSATAKVCDALAHDRHFWRGVVDGDGCVHNPKQSRRVIDLAGSPFLVAQFRAFVKVNLPHVQMHSWPQPGCEVTTAARWREGVDVLVLLYKDAAVLLPRKGARYEGWVKKKNPGP